MRALLFDDGPLSDLVLSTFIARREALQPVAGPRPRDRRPALVRTRRCGCSTSPAATGCRSPGASDDDRCRAGRADELPLVRLPGGAELRAPSPASCLARSGSAASSRRAKRSTCSSSAAGRPASARPCTAPPRASTRSSSRARRSAGRRARRAGSRTTSASRPASPAPSSPAARSPRRASSARGRRRPTGRSRSSPETGATSCGSRRSTRSPRAPCCSQPARSTGACRSTASPTTRGSASSTPRGRRRRSCAAPRASGVVGGGNSAGQAAVWLARGGALVTLLHRRADLRETMSDYLVRELERYGVAVRDRSEIAALHGADGQLEAVTLDERRAPAVLVPVPLSRCAALHRVAGRRRRRATRTASSSPAPTRDADDLLETSVPGVFAAGDVRSGSTKRCATAVGEGAMAVQFVHEHLRASALSEQR